MQRSYADWLQHLTPRELSRLVSYKAVCALESAGFTNQEAKRLVFLKTLAVEHPLALHIGD